MTCMCRAIERELSAEQGTDLMENIVVLHIPNKYVTAALCVQKRQWLLLCRLCCLYICIKKNRPGDF